MAVMDGVNEHSLFELFQISRWFRTRGHRWYCTVGSWVAVVGTGLQSYQSCGTNHWRPWTALCVCRGKGAGLII